MRDDAPREAQGQRSVAREECPQVLAVGAPLRTLGALCAAFSGSRIHASKLRFRAPRDSESGDERAARSARKGAPDSNVAKGREETTRSRRSRMDYWQASQISGFAGAPFGAAPGRATGVKLVSLETVAWRMRVAGRERR